jgi:hypothetical protein
MSMQVATTLQSASETNTAMPSRESVCDQIRSACSFGSAQALTSDARNNAIRESRSVAAAGLLSGIQLVQSLGLASHRRQHLIAAIIGVKFSAALSADGSAAHGWRSILGSAERTTQAIGALARLTGGEGRARYADEAYKKRSGGDLDDQSHGQVPPRIIVTSRLFRLLISPKPTLGCLQIGPVLA